MLGNCQFPEGQKLVSYSCRKLALYLFGCSKTWKFHDVVYAMNVSLEELLLWDCHIHVFTSFFLTNKTIKTVCGGE